MNPYEVSKSIGTSAMKPRPVSEYFSLSGAMKRWSLAFVCGAFLGVLFSIAMQTGTWRDFWGRVASRGGLQLYAITLPFACVASIAFPLKLRSSGQAFIRMLSGGTLCLTFFPVLFLLRFLYDHRWGDPVYTKLFYLVLLPLASFVISLLVSVFVEYTMTLLVTHWTMQRPTRRKPTATTGF